MTSAVPRCARHPDAAAVVASLPPAEGAGGQTCLGFGNSRVWATPFWLVFFFPLK